MNKKQFWILLFSGIVIWGTLVFLVFKNRAQNSGRSGLPAGVLSILFLDVGDGDAILISTPDGRVSLIDGGSGILDTKYNKRADTLMAVLKRLGVKEISIVFLTHPHSDHLGGLLEVMEQINVAKVYDNGASHTTSAYKKYLKLIYNNKIDYSAARQDDVLDLGGGVFAQVLSFPPNEKTDLNNASLVLKLSYGSVSILMTGDVEKTAEESLVLRYGNGLKATVIKVPHHGADKSSSRNFVRFVGPEIAVISAGNNKRFNNPSAAVVKRYSGAGAKLFITKKDGIIAFFTDGNKFFTKKHFEKELFVSN